MRVQGRAGNLMQHGVHRLRIAGGLVLQHIGGMVRIAEQPRALGAQPTICAMVSVLSLAPPMARAIEA